MEDRYGKMSNQAITMDVGGGLEYMEVPVVVEKDSDGTDVARTLLSNGQIRDLAEIVSNRIKPENMDTETREVLRLKVDSLINENGKLRKDCDNLRRWNKHLEQKLLNFVELAFKQMGGAAGPTHPGDEAADGG